MQSQSFSMIAESRHLLPKRTRQAHRPLEIFICAAVATLAYTVVYIAMAFGLRYEDITLAYLLGPVPMMMVAVALLPLAYVRMRRRRASRSLWAVSVCMAAGVILGYIYGNDNYNMHTSYFYNLRDMASYTNVDPGVDQGQGFMDAGTIYFKEGSFVLKRKALAFHNGHTYCVAPITRSPLELDNPAQQNGFQLATATGYSTGRSGTVDFWAVGIDCCGKTGTDGEGFTCGDTNSQVARSGMRLLNSAERENYLVAVQQWSASIGLPAKHPLFFTWVKDPLSTTRVYYQEAWNQFWLNFIFVFLGSIVVSFSVHALCKWFTIM